MGWANDQIALLIISASGVFSGLFEYSPSPGLNNLVASITPASGTDPYGNRYAGPGFFSYANDGASNFYQAQFTAARLGIRGVAGMQLNYSTSAGVAGTTRGGVYVISNSGATGQILITTSASLVPATAALLEVQGTAALQNATAPAAVVGYAEPFAIGGNLAFVNGLTGDGATYDTGRRTLFATGQTVNSVAFTNITGVGTFNLGIGTYRIYGKIHITTTIAGGAAELKFVLTGAGSLTGVAVCRESKVPSAAAVTWGQGNIISLSGATVFTTSALGAADTMIDIDCMHAVVTTAAVTLTPQVAVTIAADTYAITSDSYFEILPVN